jgi:hypothetical protein
LLFQAAGSIISGSNNSKLELESLNQPSERSRPIQLPEDSGHSCYFPLLLLKKRDVSFFDTSKKESPLATLRAIEKTSN